MKSIKFKVIVLFFLVGFGSGLLSVLVAIWSKAWGWVGLGAILAAGLVVSTIIAAGLKWLPLKLSLWRSFFATLIVIAAYPVAVLVMLGSAFWFDSVYASRFGGPSVIDGLITGLYPAAIVGAMLVSIALSVLSRKWEKQVMLLLVIAGMVTIPVSQFIATLIGERNWHLVLFPVGEALFSALSGYWLLRASSDNKHDISSPSVGT